jgi:hypothetical protein
MAKFVGQGAGESYGPSLSFMPSELPSIDPGTAQSLRGITSLSSEKIRAAVRLSRDQEGSVERIFNDTARRLQELYSSKTSRPASEWSRDSSQIVDEAIQRVLCTLTDEQIERWRKELLETAASRAQPDHQARS